MTQNEICRYVDMLNEYEATFFQIFHICTFHNENLK